MKLEIKQEIIEGFLVTKCAKCGELLGSWPTECVSRSLSIFKVCPACDVGGFKWEQTGSIYSTKKGRIFFEIIEHPEDTYPFNLGIWYGGEFPDVEIENKHFEKLKEAQEFCRTWLDKFQRELI